jgi:hypothetical protein
MVSVSARKVFKKISCLCTFKGTVRPDWISLRVVPLGMPQTGFFNFASSEPLHTKMNPTSCLLGSRFVWNPFFLLAVSLLFVEKIRQTAALFWFRLRIVGFLQTFYSRAVIQEHKVGGW